MSQERQFAWAPEDTPEWLRTHPSFEARGEQNFVEIDEAIGGEVPEELLAEGWGRVPQSMWDALLSKLHSGNLARALYFHALQHDADRHGIGLTQWDARALGYIHVLYNGSPVWWTDLDDGPVAAVTLFDLVVGTQQPAKDDEGHTKMWMMSRDQWDNAEWPPESKGGPPYTPHISVAREARDHFNDPWPPNEHGVIHTQIDMPKGPPRWLETASAPGTIAVRIDTAMWKEVLRADGYGLVNLPGETPEDALDRHAKWFLEVLTGGRRNEGDGSMSPNSIYIDAARYFQPRVRFAKYGGTPSGGKKHGIWAGAGLYKKESIREILQAVVVTKGNTFLEGSTVWLYDLEAGKPDRVLTLWEMIGDWFVDVDGKRIGARQNTGAFGPLPVYFIDMMREPGTARMRAPEKKLWPMSERMWAEGQWPEESFGGPPHARYGMEASEAPSTMRLFHGTKHAHVEKLVPSKGGEFGPGIYLTADPNTARFFAGNALGPDEPTVLEVVADIRNPIRIRKTDWIKKTQNRTPSAVQRALKKKGHDAIIGIGLTDSEQIIVFDADAVRIVREAAHEPMAAEQTSQERFFAAAPGFTPDWLLIRKTPPEAKVAQKRQMEFEFGGPENRRWRHRHRASARKRHASAKRRFLANLPKMFVEILPPPWDTIRSERSGHPLYTDYEDWVQELDILASYPSVDKYPAGLVADQKTFLQNFGIVHNGSPVWWIDLDQGPQRAATLYDLALKPPPKAERDLWLMTIDQWDNASYPPPSKGGPPYVKGVSVARERENPIAVAAESTASESDDAFVCLGRNIILQLGENDFIELPRRWGMLRDESSRYWPKCSLLFAEFAQGKEEDDAAIGRNYFGRKAKFRRGCVEMPPHDLRNGWREVGFVEEVFYERAGTKAPGKFHHKFNDPRGWMWLVALIKRRVAKTPPVLFEYDCDGVVALRLELPDGCIIHEGGIALP